MQMPAAIAIARRGAAPAAGPAMPVSAPAAARAQPPPPPTPTDAPPPARGAAGAPPPPPQRVPAAGADADDPVLRLQDVAGAGKDQRHVLVGDRHHRFEAAAVAVGAPILGQLDAGAGELPRMLLQLGFEPLEQRDRVGRGAGKP